MDRVVLKIIKKVIFSFILSIFYLNPTTYAADSWIQNLPVDAKIDYVQKYMWRGFDALNGDPAIQPSFTLDFGRTGYYVGIWGSFALDEKWRKWDELDFYAGYYNSLWKKDWYALDIDISYTYVCYPRQDRNQDTHEIALALKFPNVIPPIGPSNLVPYSTFYYGRSVTGNADDGLWIKLGTYYELPVPAVLPWQEKQTLTTYVETFHNDGAQAAKVDPGWSHLVTGITSTFRWRGIGFTPGIHYQWSWEDTVNKKNEFWFTFSVSYKF